MEGTTGLWVGSMGRRQNPWQARVAGSVPRQANTYTWQAGPNRTQGLGQCEAGAGRGSWMLGAREVPRPDSEVNELYGMLLAGASAGKTCDEPGPGPRVAGLWASTEMKGGAGSQRMCKGGMWGLRGHVAARRQVCMSPFSCAGKPSEGLSIWVTGKAASGLLWEESRCRVSTRGWRPCCSSPLYLLPELSHPRAVCCHVPTRKEAPHCPGPKCAQWARWCMLSEECPELLAGWALPSAGVPANSPAGQGGRLGHLPRTVMASPSSPQPSSCSMLASRMAKATCRITLMPS